MMKRSLHLLALLLFALTQFVAPFAHAHVGGSHRDDGIHIDALPHLHADATSGCHFESHESAAVTPQIEFQRDAVLALPSAPAQAVQPTIAGYPLTLAFPAPSFHSTNLSYQRPHPQAPPV
jgi:hypothetical protein